MSNVLTFEIEKTIEWRKRKLEKHQQDSRLYVAVDTLEKLAAMPVENKTLSREYDELHESDELTPELLGEVHSNVLGDIGFGFHPTHIDEVIAAILNSAKNRIS